jgi:Ser/Thr protein kinase RdoA (MazF antagonist)
VADGARWPPARGHRPEHREVSVDLAAPLSAYDLGRPVSTTQIAGGLINLSYRVDSARGRFVLQRVNPLFGPEVHEDIDAVTTHLQRKGLPTTRLVRTRTDTLCTQQTDGVWRLLTFLDGETHHQVDSPALAEAAGEGVGRFHAALADLRHDFRFRRSGVHDTHRHFALLDVAIDAHSANPHHAAIAALRDELRAGIAALPDLTATSLPRRVAHGDLKISNLLFTAEGVSLVDLDTLGEMILPYELGDAWRSWCNPRGEDDESAFFDPALLTAAWRGYSRVTTPTEEERSLIVPGILTICLELSARFARDVLEDKYFGWDAARFPSRIAHNLVRARSQAAEYRSLAALELSL